MGTRAQNVWARSGGLAVFCSVKHGGGVLRMEEPRQLGSGKWQARVTGPDGVRHAAGTHTSKRAAVQAQAIKLAELVAAKDEEAPRTTPFTAYAEGYVHSRRPGEVDGLAPSTYRMYLALLKATLIPTFGGTALEAITPLQVRNWWLKNSGTPSRRQSAYYLLKSILDQALDDEILTRNPARVKRAGTNVAKARPTFTDADVARLLAATEDAPMRTLLILLVGSAMRIGEALALDWAHVEFFDGAVHVERHWTPHGLREGTKAGTEKTRTLALPSWAREALEALYSSGGGEGPVFRNTCGT